MKRFLSALFTAIFVTLATAGCLKVDMGMVVSGTDTVSGTTTFAFNKEMISIATQNGASKEMFDTTTLFAQQAGITVAPYSDDKFEGTTYTFKDVALDKFFSSSSSSSLHIERQGDKLIVAGLLDTSGGSTEVESVKSNPQAKKLFEGSGITVRITLPGKILSTNGKQDGNTIVWTGEIGSTINFKAEAEAPYGSKDVAPTSVPVSGTNSSWIWWTVGGAIVVLAAGVVTFVLLRRKRSN